MAKKCVCVCVCGRGGRGLAKAPHSPSPSAVPDIPLIDDFLLLCQKLKAQLPIKQYIIPLICLVLCSDWSELSTLSSGTNLAFFGSEQPLGVKREQYI